MKIKKGDTVFSASVTGEIVHISAYYCRMRRRKNKVLCAYLTIIVPGATIREDTGEFQKDIPSFFRAIVELDENENVPKLNIFSKTKLGAIKALFRRNLTVINYLKSKKKFDKIEKLKHNNEILKKYLRKKSK